MTVTIEDVRKAVEGHFTLPFTPHRYQWEAVVDAINSGVNTLHKAKVGCVDGETEYLTPDKGWVKIKDYTKGDYVCQINVVASNPSTSEFVEPQAFTKFTTDKIYHIKNKYGLDQMITPDHTMLLRSSSKYGVQNEVSTAEGVYLRLRDWASGVRSSAKTGIPTASIAIPTACRLFDGNPGIKFTDDELRLMVAVAADGHYKANCATSVTIRVKKEDKKTRIVKLLNACGIPFTERSKDYPTAVGYTVYDFRVTWRRKRFPMSWVSQVTEHQARVICEECLLWDGGCYGKRRQFFSRTKESADFIQILFTGLGVNTSIKAISRVRDRGGKESLETDYLVSPASSGNGYVAIVGHSGKEKFSNIEVINNPVEVYCFTVPSGFLLLRRNGRIFVTGNCGKTLISTILALYTSVKMDTEQILVTMPPALIDQWEEFILSVKGIGDALIFRGSPEERKKMDLSKFPVVLVSDRIFIRDFKRFERMGKQHKLFVIGDELSLKSSSKTYKCWKQLIYRKTRVVGGVDKPFHYFCGLNATPVSSREQVYWWCSLFHPKAYISYKMFKRLHVASEDNWGAPLSFMNLELMDKNFDAIAIEPQDTNLQMPDQVFTKIPYSLTSKHKKMYEALLSAEFEQFDPKVIGAVDSLFSILQRAILVPEELGLNIRPPILDIIHGLLDQMDDDDKVIIYTRHVVVSKMLLEEFGDRAVGAFGAVSKNKKRENIQRFKAGEAEIMVANLDSLSKGQNLQVANHTIFAELPFRSDVMTQACGRTARQGQKKDTCFFYLPVAKGTIQAQICRNLLNNDMDLKRFNNNPKTLLEYLNV